MIPKIEECIQIVSDSIISQQNLNNISFALEVRTQRWYKDLLQECREIKSTAELLLVDLYAFIKSDRILGHVNSLLKSSIEVSSLKSLYSILSSYKYTECCILVLDSLLGHIHNEIAVDKNLGNINDIFAAYEKLIELSSCNTADQLKDCMNYMKSILSFIEQYSDQADVEYPLLYLISKAWNLGVEEYDYERDHTAKDLFLIAKAGIDISNSIIDKAADMKYNRLQTYVNRWGKSITEAANVFID